MTMPIIPDRYTETETKNHFPIIMQITLLTLLLSTIFGSLWLFADNEPPMPASQQAVGRNTALIDTTNPHAIPGKISGVDLRAEAAYVWDVRGQQALYKQNESAVLPLASITKLMTALVAHELIADQDNITIPITAIRQEGNSGLVAGEVLTVEELSEFALLTSSNDAAYTLAASVGTLLGDNDPAAQFVAGMNIRAEELGLNTLQFENMTGLDMTTQTPGATGSAKDVSFLLEYIVENYPAVLTPTTDTSSRVYNSAGAFHDLTNTNVIADRIPNLIGSKTGYTDLAGGNLTVAFDLGNNRPIIITVLGSTRDERFTDVLSLVEAVQATVATNN